jgi:hypothetical protein
MACSGLLLNSLLTTTGLADELVQVGIEAKLDLKQRIVAAEMRVSLPASLAGQGVRVELPSWEDLRAGGDRMQSFNRNVREQAQDELTYANIPRVQLLEESRDGQQIRLRFVTALESGGDRSEAAAQGQWILAHWYPRLVFASARSPQSAVNIRFEAPAAYVPFFAAASQQRGDQLGIYQAVVDTQLNGVIDPQAELTELAQQEQTITNSGARIHVLHHQNPSFVELVQPIGRAYEYLSKILGGLGKNPLLVIESNRPWPKDLEGLLPIQIPGQSLVRWVVTSQSHWLQWHAIEELAGQWWGVRVRFNGGDLWLRDGLAAYATLQVLSRHLPEKDQAFATEAGLLRFVQWNYLQHLSAYAAILERSGDEPPLIGSEPFGRHALSFVRVPLALRQAASRAGLGVVEELLRQSFGAWRGQALSAEEWYRQILTAASHEAELRSILSAWLTSAGWWDPALESCEIQAGKAKVRIMHRGSIEAVPVVRVTDRHGRSAAGPVARTGLLTSQDGPLTDCDAVLIDPDHHGFDADRFNNRNDWGGVGIFPGTARTLRDDATTFVWAPFALRRSGDPWVYGIGIGALRYVRSGFFLWAGYAPHSEDWTGMARYQSLVTVGGFGLLADLERRLSGDSSLQLEISRQQLNRSSDLTANVGIEAFLPAGAADQLHFPLRLSLGYYDLSSWDGRLRFGAESELSYVAPDLAPDFSYQRLEVLANLMVEPLHWLGLMGRAFYGELSGSGPLPNGVYIDPQATNGAYIRIDDFDRERLAATRLIGGTLELRSKIPFLRSRADAGILVASRARLALFADAGHLRGPYLADEAELKAYGFGARLPLGGDISGAGTVVFTNLNLDLVWRSEVGGVVDQTPSILLGVGAR